MNTVTDTAREDLLEVARLIGGGVIRIDVHPVHAGELAEISIHFQGVFPTRAFALQRALSDELIARMGMQINEVRE